MAAATGTDQLPIGNICLKRNENPVIVLEIDRRC